MSWREQFWTRLGGEKPTLRFHLTYRRFHENRILVELIAGEPRVPVNDDLLAMLDRIDPHELRRRLRSDQFESWESQAAAIRGAAGKTVSLYMAATGVLVPLLAHGRTTTSTNVYRMSFDLDELRAIVDSEIRDKLAHFRTKRATPHEIARLLGIATPQAAPGADATSDEDEPVADTTDAEEPADEAPVEKATWDQHHNLIFFGPPGTGKSYQLQQIVERHLRATPDRVYRVTFHPETSYFDFVGTYKPRVGWVRSVNDFTDADRTVHSNREPRVYYAFDPGPFSRALADALRHHDQTVVVIVEEINRGNCAAIFGDVFQLLDRAGEDRSPEEWGRSEYPITPSAEWHAWLDEALSDVRNDCWKDGRLRLPGNLYLYATMNTSDQSLFPMDTAFRRRFGLQYVGVETNAAVRTQVRLHADDRDGVSWLDFTRALNRAIVDHTRTDDKQMGPWFVQPTRGERFVSDVQFRSKVLFYLWSDVFRDAPHKVFDRDIQTYDQLTTCHAEGQRVFADELERLLRNRPA